MNLVLIVVTQCMMRRKGLKRKGMNLKGTLKHKMGKVHQHPCGTM